MDRMEKLTLKRLGWSVAGLGMFGVTRVVRRRYGVRTVGRVPFPVALGVAGLSALVQRQVEAAERAYQYEKGRADEAAEFAADNEALREAMADDDGTRIPMVEVNGYIRDVADGGIPIDDQVKAAVERVLRRQESEGQHPSNGVA